MGKLFKTNFTTPDIVLIPACIGINYLGKLFAAVLVSTPLNIIFWGGTTGNVWGDAVFAATQAAKMPVFLGSLLDEIVVDVPDKIITLAIVYFIIKGLPKKLTALYDAGSDIQSLD